ncbi:RloB family protein [Cellvibrio japonicus]|uniref:CRISPR-associated protein, Csm2 family n=1 Tax=Cellvibrio japonicus (strain Ueda107) TaxID=498211 RepID=B3PE73_CELJU|nr:RloB family protein [Cellvibrio japonicus]ACE84110.1 CRISPR-associated protein, Csm2 family [Cellvibrio japonicus Ueda107]QEI12115.1 RloB domain-containing protein [Cellvibrio japonicus]QEI15689.1 RloB domain-containing protein [Cellvibrio japonicus]QEI19267.1 RloB domain-containing protein [Cellvibrio japonicus]
MGTDNLFHRRKARLAQSLQRRKATRAPYAKVLIVCEGSKTEPHYFEGLKNHYQLSSTNIEITGESGSSPISVFEYAQQRYDQEKLAGDPFDRVYCVFDKDTHSSYQDACDRIEKATPKNTYFSITSVPCFEYWLLLHYRYTTAPYQPLPGNSAANQVLSQLKNYFPGYQKGSKNIFAELSGQLEFAKNNAQRALAAAIQQHTDNPSTKIHELVEFLQNIKG